MNDIEGALEALDAGGVIVLPTDTVYGLAARPRLPDAIRRIFAIKGRPSSKPLPVLGASLDDLRAVADFDERAEALARSQWPGPLTLVLPRAVGFQHDLGGDDASVAVRVPASKVALELLRRSGPLAVTSANRSGGREALSAAAARAELGDEVAVYLDGGRGVGEPSTVVSLLGAEIEVLRRGALGAERLTGRPPGD